MTKYGSADVGIFAAGGYDILGTLTQFEDRREAITVESHTLGDAWVEHSAVGITRGTLTQQGFYDDAALSQHAALEANLATSKVLCYGIEGNTSGKNFVGWSGALTVNYERVAAVEDLTRANAEYRNSGVIEQGRILRPLAGATASGNTTAAGIDFSASNVSGGAAYLQVTSFTSSVGVTAIAIDVLHSADNLTYASWLGFTNVTAAPAAERISSTAPLQRYAAVKWQGSSGAAFPASAIFFVGLSRR